jgi:UPF0755 protein
VSTASAARGLAALVLALALASGALAAAPDPVMRVVFPEGFSSRQMVDRIAEVHRIATERRGVTPRLTGAAYRQALRRASPPAEFRPFLERRSLEGFLFPATYEFTKRTTAGQLVAAQLRAFRERWSRVPIARARMRGLNPYEVLIVASIVEREAAVPAERRLIAAVVMNRLDAGMPLGIDATLRYGLGIEGTRSITRAHLANPSPYNTSRFRGLPPTPISNPGLASMRAAGAPARVDYLYYLRIPETRRHFFTADESEFCAKALEYGYRGC